MIPIVFFSELSIAIILIIALILGIVILIIGLLYYAGMLKLSEIL